MSRIAGADMPRLLTAASRVSLDRSDITGWVWWVCLGGLCLVLLTPLLVVDVPPLVDYPNHLARAFVLSALPGDPVLARFYAPHWAVIPNLALDMIAPPLMHILPVHVVGRLLIGAAVLLPVLGAVAYSTALGGRWWCLAVGLIAYNGTLLEGFLNFNLSAGLALLLTAAWLRWREVRPRRAVTIAILGAALLFACHLMGLLFFAILIGSSELFQILRDPAGRVTNTLRRGAVLVLVFAAPAALYAASALSDLGGDASFLPVGEKLAQLFVAFANYSPALDIATAALALACPCLCLLLRRGGMPASAAIATAVVLLAYLLAPYAWKGTYQLDTRFAVMLGFLLFAGFVPRRWPGWLSRLVTIAVTGVFAARMALLITAWVEHRADLAALRQALAPVLPGQAVYVVSALPTDPDTYWAQAPWPRRLATDVQTDTHIAALALIERRAWWPFAFDVPSQQPIVTLEPYRSLAGRVGDLPDQTKLLTADLCGFDAVLVTQADSAPDLPADRFVPRVRAGFAALYGIKDCRAPG